MALSNAERQRRWREQQKKLLRNVQSPRRSLARIQYEEFLEDPEGFGYVQGEGEALQEFLAKCVVEAVDDVASILDHIELASESRRAETIDIICGPAYYAEYKRYVTARQERHTLRGKAREAYKMPPLPDPEKT